MRPQPAGLSRLPLYPQLAVVLAALTSALSLPGLSGAAVPLVVTTVLLAVLAFAAAVSGLAPGAVQVVLSCRRGTSGTRSPARQCDPDAAGHARPRAPGAAAAPCTG